jgi:hypothetical protein
MSKLSQSKNPGNIIEGLNYYKGKTPEILSKN